MPFAAWQDSQMNSGEPEDEADLQFGVLEKIFCIGETICRHFYCFPAGSWRFAGLNSASFVVGSCSSNVQPHLPFGTSHRVVVLLWVVWSTGGQHFSHHHLETHSVSCPPMYFFFIYLWGWNESCILQSGEMEKE